MHVLRPSFFVMKGMWEMLRSSGSRDVLIQNLKTATEYFAHPQNMFINTANRKEFKFVKSLNQLNAILGSVPDIAMEAFMLGFEYDIATRNVKNFRTNIKNDLKTGKVYPAGTFVNVFAYSTKKVSVVKLNLSARTIDEIEELIE